MLKVRKTARYPGVLVILLLLAPIAQAQQGSAQSSISMLESVRAGWTTYIFVSTAMPRSSLVDLAREAGRAHATLVFRGFAQPAAAKTAQTADQAVDMQGLQDFVASINAQCCKVAAPAWIVDPRLYERYGVRAVPSFVLAWGESPRSQDYARVDGDFALANALKCVAQRSINAAMRDRASEVYRLAYGGRT